MEKGKNSTSHICNGNGYKLYSRYWEPIGKPRAIVFISHGFSEHSHYYETLAQALVGLQCFVLAHDHVGHGQSEGPKVQIEDVDSYVKDVFQHTDMMKEKYADLPLFYFGHSMGGTMGARAAILRPHYFKGVVLTGPALSIRPEAANDFVKTMCRLLGWILPNFPTVPLDYNIVTRDRDITQARIKDPLSWHGYARAGWCHAMLKSIEEIGKNAEKIECPILLMHGDADKVCGLDGSQALYEKCSSTDKSLKIYIKAYHNLLDEPEGVKEQVLEDIVQWLDQRIE